MVSGGFGFPHISLPHLNWGGIVHTIVHKSKVTTGVRWQATPRGASMDRRLALGCSHRRRGRRRLRAVLPGFRLGQRPADGPIASDAFFGRARASPNAYGDRAGRRIDSGDDETGLRASGAADGPGGGAAAMADRTSVRWLG
jgi:hypothetical protein